MEDDAVSLTLTFSEGGGDAVDVVVALRGDLDASSAPELVEAVTRRRPLAAITIDVSKLAFVDSAGLRALLTIRHMVEADAGTQLRLRGVGPDLDRLLEICGMHDAFEQTD